MGMGMGMPLHGGEDSMEIKVQVRVVWGTPCPTWFGDSCRLDLTQLSKAIICSGAGKKLHF